MFFKRFFFASGLIIGIAAILLFVFRSKAIEVTGTVDVLPQSVATATPVPAPATATPVPAPATATPVLASATATPIPASATATPTPPVYFDLPGLGRAPEISGVTHWVNSEPLTLESLRGKVVLIDFWTYGCINCIRTLPYVTDWHQKYADEGLVIIGIHRPEFTYEHSTANVEEALERFGITYPVAQDNDFTTWRAYKNRYWPAFYFIDAQGEIRYIHIGEGSYEKSEKIIQQLLAEASP
jgi:thiol-disulfide isomerase/thioredoxin